MSDVASITIAVVSLVSSILTALAGGWWAFYSEERKDRIQTERLLRKYRDPLLLAAQDLQARLYNVVGQALVERFLERGQQSDDGQQYKDALYIYTAFLFGQYLCWVYILRRQTRFLCFTTQKKTSTKTLIELLDCIASVLNTDKHTELPFRLWKGHQLAIGELMCVLEGDELMCMGFSTFTRKWKEAESSSQEAVAFCNWFQPIVSGIKSMDEASKEGQKCPDDRLRRLQHCLGDLVSALDINGIRSLGTSSKIKDVPHCPCQDCQTSFKSTKYQADVISARQGEIA
ncbi:hypothetical protein B0A50_05143 [Salinomyces thailandicus]|uniref:Uncharacterized protein n=1 Tax=Salinomyces thailandicus TaxID=706561 RepID=A0A4U0TVR3_9PEZI|nr:hypothetical protein B0A50_05143 [Salinomyces thailandica]